MDKIRKIKSVFKAQPVREGAGVNLKRVFGYYQVPQLDPFLLMDDFHSLNPQDYIAGFPWHPHRGIETISYILHGQVEHGDSLGNKGVITAGDVQWMTAGNGIIHQEMPKGDKNKLLWGFQVWANLPAKQKMKTPRYQEIRKNQIPVLKQDSGVVIKILCGRFNDITGPVQDIVTDPDMFDISIPPKTLFVHPTKPEHTVFVYIYQGAAQFPVLTDAGNTLNNKSICAENAVLFSPGHAIKTQAGENGAHMLLLAGNPINEPVAWAGPIVMNTKEEIRTAFEELEQKIFIKHKPLI
ncbi:pirin family protein [candidate division KSB1 bacterium]|nr:pirin family protein [candidate division KSB1 bacterium]